MENDDKNQQYEPIKVSGPFAIFIEEELDEPGCWIAKIVGRDFDNVTFSYNGPIGAAYMAYDCLCALTDQRAPEEKDGLVEDVVVADEI